MVRWRVAGIALGALAGAVVSAWVWVDYRAALDAGGDPRALGFGVSTCLASSASRGHSPWRWRPLRWRSLRWRSPERTAALGCWSFVSQCPRWRGRGGPGSPCGSPRAFAAHTPTGRPQKGRHDHPPNESLNLASDRWCAAWRSAECSRRIVRLHRLHPSNQATLSAPDHGTQAPARPRTHVFGAAVRR